MTDPHQSAPRAHHIPRSRDERVPRNVRARARCQASADDPVEVSCLLGGWGCPRRVTRDEQCGATLDRDLVAAGLRGITASGVGGRQPASAGGAGPEAIYL